MTAHRDEQKTKGKRRKEKEGKRGEGKKTVKRGKDNIVKPTQLSKLLPDLIFGHPIEANFEWF